MQSSPESTSKAPWAVHKFGGTSLGDATRISRAVDLILAEPPEQRVAIVVSAMAGVTDALIRATELAAARDDSYRETLAELRERHAEVADELLGAGAPPFVAAVEADLADIEDVLRGVRVAGASHEQTLDLVSGFGEIWSAQLVRATLALREPGAEWLNARQVLVVSHGETGPSVDWEVSGARLEAWLAEHDARVNVITGYVATDEAGVATTLKRNGSDFSASIFGRLLGARSVTIWTDVEGVLSADPRSVPEAVVLSELSYDEAMELAFFGAKVLHPHTMSPAIELGIPIRIRSVFAPDAPGTMLGGSAGETPVHARAAVKGFSSMDGIALLNVEGAGMIGVPGTAHRLFSALRELGVSVIMISQASSEHSICVAIRASDGERAKEALERVFAAELQHGQIRTVDVSGPYGVLAAVGDDMVHTPGVSARFFGALGKAGINVRAIAQGSSERNISVVLAEEDRVRALRAVHSGFYLSDQTLSVGIVGPGQVGSELLRQIESQAELLEERQIGLRVRAIMTSKRMLLEEGEIALADWGETFERDGVAPDFDAFVEHVAAEHLPHAVIVDCTANGEVAARYASWLERGIHVVTPNKKAGSDAFERYRRVRELGRKLNTHFLYEATVGAGLPVITTLRDLVQTGDRVKRIEGVLSGTLSFLFDEVSADRPFSSVVAEARRLGYTEPDPREDLSGMDVARKAVILARELGAGLELVDVAVESLVPAPLREASSPEAFLAGLADHDEAIERLRAEADAAGEVLRHVAVIDPEGAATVGLRRYPREHPFARIHGGDNIIAFTTERYSELPLIVQGPGAGIEVTAGGIFADLLRLAAYVGAPS